MDQDPNTPPPNQNQQSLGFSQFAQTPEFRELISVLRQGGLSPNIPNQRQFTPTVSPTIPFQNLQQNFHPRAIYNQNFNDPRAFAQPEFQNPNFYGGGSSSAQYPQNETQMPPTQEVFPETQMPPSQETVPETQRPRREPKNKQKAPTTKRGKTKPSLEIQG